MQAPVGHPRGGVQDVGCWSGAQGRLLPWFADSGPLSCLLNSCLVTFSFSIFLPPPQLCLWLCSQDQDRPGPVQQTLGGWKLGHGTGRVGAGAVANMAPVVGEGRFVELWASVYSYPSLPGPGVGFWGALPSPSVLPLQEWHLGFRFASLERSHYGR